MTDVHHRLLGARIQQSMTRGGGPDENAHIESFFHSLKADAIHGRSFSTLRRAPSPAPS